MGALLGKPRVVDNPGEDAARSHDLRQHLVADPRQNGLVRPLGLCHHVVQGLVGRLHTPWFHPWCKNGAAEQGRLLDQAANAGRLTVRSSLSGAMVSSVM